MVMAKVDLPPLLALDHAQSSTTLSSYKSKLLIVFDLFRVLPCIAWQKEVLFCVSSLRFTK